MNEANEFLLRTIEENWTHARQAEEKRANIANLTILIFAAAQLELTLVGLNSKSLPLTILLVLLGIYGIATTAKLYERSQFHILRARKLRTHLDELCANAHVEMLQKDAENEHEKRYPRLIKLHLNTIWLLLHIVVLTIGIIYTLMIMIVTM